MTNPTRHILTAVAALAILASPAGAYATQAPAPQRIEVSEAPTVKATGGRVEITVYGDDERQVQVFALTGQLIATVNAQPGITVIELPAGYYIVKCDRMAQRVIVR